MPKNRTLKEISEQFSLSSDKIVSFLSSKMHFIINDPDTKITDVQYNVLYEQYYGQKKWEDTDNRFVVYLDIMGFKDFVSRNTHIEVYNRLQKVSTFKNTSEKFANAGFTTDEYNNHVKFEILHTTMFSDSLILFSKDDTQLSLATITREASSLFADAYKNSIPMKGSIAYGQISVNRTKGIYCGQALIDAYLLQEDVNYYGIVAHHSIDEYLINHEVNQYHRDCYIDIKTPLKSGKISHYNLNWFASLSLLSILGQGSPKEEFFNEIKKLKAMTSGAPRKYIDNTIEVFDLIYPEAKSFAESLT